MLIFPIERDIKKLYCSVFYSRKKETSCQTLLFKKGPNTAPLVAHRTAPASARWVQKPGSTWPQILKKLRIRGLCAWSTVSQQRNSPYFSVWAEKVKQILEESIFPLQFCHSFGAGAAATLQAWRFWDGETKRRAGFLGVFPACEEDSALSPAPQLVCTAGPALTQAAKLPVRKRAGWALVSLETPFLWMRSSSNRLRPSSSSSSFGHLCPLQRIKKA